MCCRIIPFGSVSAEFLNADIVLKGKVEEYRHPLSAEFPLPHFACTLLPPLGGLQTLFEGKPTFHFPRSIFFFFFTKAYMKVSPHSPFPPVRRLKVQRGAASIGLLFFPLQEILIANKPPSSKAHDGWTACNNFTLFLLFPQGLALHKVTYSYWSL